MFPLRLIEVFVAETVGDAVLFPLWWYTNGLLRAVKGAGTAIARRERSLALGLWIVNIFRPMYGQHDWQGKLISFVFRVLVLIWRFVFFVLWILLVLAALLVYIALPVIAVYGIMQNF